MTIRRGTTTPTDSCNTRKWVMTGDEGRSELIMLYRNCFVDALETFEETASTYEEDYLGSIVSPENAYLRTMNLCKQFSEFIRTHNFGYCQGVGHFTPVIRRENIGYVEENRQIFNSTHKMGFSGIVDISRRSLRVGEGLLMLTDNVAASLIDYSMTDMKKEPNKNISLANEIFQFHVKKERIYGSSGTKSLRTIVLPQSIVVLVFRGVLDKKEWAGTHKVVKRM